MLAHVCPPSHWPACSVRLAIVTLSLGRYLTFFFNGRTFFFFAFKMETLYRSRKRETGIVCHK